MITCEQFEKGFEAWQSGKLKPEEAELFRRHVIECTHCRAFTPAAYRLRELTASLPQVEPSLGFTYRLSNRINELSTKDVRTTKTAGRLLPRWAALGAGLASGLAIGLIIILSPNSDDISKSGISMTDTPIASHESATINLVDTTKDNQDSLEATEQLYDLDRKYQVVSDGK